MQGAHRVILLAYALKSGKSSRKKRKKKKEKLTVIFCVQLLKKNTQPFLHGVITRKLLFRGIFKWILTSNADVVVFETH